MCNQHLTLIFVTILIIIKDVKGHCRREQTGSHGFFSSITDVTIICSDTNLNELQQYEFQNEGDYYPIYLKIENSSISKLIPFSLKKFSRISKLLMIDINVTNILPGTFNVLTNLQELYLDDNHLTEIDDGLFNHLTSLKILSLTRNHIHFLGQKSFVDMTNLQILDLSHNNISVLNEEIFSYPHNLLKLDLSFNRIDSISHLTVSVKLLDLGFNEIETVDFEFLQGPIDAIILNNNRVNWVEHLEHVKTSKLVLNFNILETLGKLGEVSSVNVSFNKLASLSNVLNPTVVEFDATFNLISYIYINEFVDLPKLKYLYLHHNELSNVSGTHFRNLTSLLLLDLSYNKLKEFTGILTYLDSLKELLLHHNELSYIYVSGFKNLKSVEFVDLSFNELTKLSYGLFDNLVALRVLNISHNKLINLYQYTFYHMSNLESINFENNDIRGLNLDHLFIQNPKLKVLYLDGNPWDCESLVVMLYNLKVKQVATLYGNSFESNNVRGIACENTHADSNQETEETTRYSYKEISTNSTGMALYQNNSVEDLNYRVMIRYGIISINVLLAILIILLSVNVLYTRRNIIPRSKFELELM